LPAFRSSAMIHDKLLVSSLFPLLHLAPHAELDHALTHASPWTLAAGCTQQTNDNLYLALLLTGNSRISCRIIVAFENLVVAPSTRAASSFYAEAHNLTTPSPPALATIGSSGWLATAHTPSSDRLRCPANSCREVFLLRSQSRTVQSVEAVRMVVGDRGDSASEVTGPG
jgi:hypothetical protein